MLHDLLFYSSITIDIQVHDYGKFVISYKNEILLDKGDSVSCQNKLRKIIDDLTNYIEDAKKMGVSLGSMVIFNIQNYGMTGQTDVTYNNILEIKNLLIRLRSSAKCDIEVRTPFHGFG